LALSETTALIYFCDKSKKLLTCYRFGTIMGAAAPIQQCQLL
jgi:hypothetical protein